ncbi:phosphatidate cytidylyltransferase [Thermoproteota archaeon]
MINRILTSILLAGWAGFVITAGNVPLIMFLWVVACVSAHEMFSISKLNPFSLPAMITYFILSMLLYSTSLNSGVEIWLSLPVQGLVLGAVVFFIAELFFHRLFLINNLFFYTARVILLIGITSSCFFLLRQGTNGLFNIWFCCGTIWVSDTVAFLGGRKFGRHRLSPISPKKTIEGAISAVIASICLGLLAALIFRLDLLMYAGLGLFISLVSQIGDLYESLIKRHFNVKDTSNILPGHGGLLDRVDSTMFIIPILFYFFN